MRINNTMIAKLTDRVSKRMKRQKSKRFPNDLWSVDFSLISTHRIFIFYFDYLILFFVWSEIYSPKEFMPRRKKARIHLRQNFCEVRRKYG